MSALAAGRPRDGGSKQEEQIWQAYTFTDVVNPADPTFNQELGINNCGVICGIYR